MIAAIRHACQRAGADPRLSRARPELGADVRSRVVQEYPYLIYFVTMPAEARIRVEIMRILHQARNVENAFSEG